MPTAAATTRRPCLAARPGAHLLVLTGSGVLAGALCRIADSVGVPVRVLTEPADAVGAWSAASAVVVGDDLVEAVSLLAPPARAGVVVAAASLPAQLWPAAAALGAEHLVELPAGAGFLTRVLEEAVRPSRGRVVAVLGGRGGAGASTLCAALGLAAVRGGLRAALVDLDPLGGGADVLLGAEDQPGFRWGDLGRGELAATALPTHAAEQPAASWVERLPVVAGLRLLSHDRSGACPDGERTVAAVRGLRRECDVVTLDVPRHLDAAARAAVGLAAVALLVVPAEVRAAAAAARVAAGLRAYAADVRLVVRGPAPAGLRAEAVARCLGLPLAGELGVERGLAAALERGEPPGLARGALARLADRLLHELVAEAAPR